MKKIGLFILSWILGSFVGVFVDLAVIFVLGIALPPVLYTIGFTFYFGWLFTRKKKKGDA